MSFKSEIEILGIEQSIKAMWEIYALDTFTDKESLGHLKYMLFGAKLAILHIGGNNTNFKAGDELDFLRDICIIKIQLLQDTEQ